jgi:hypothetical protein
VRFKGLQYWVKQPRTEFKGTTKLRGNQDSVCTDYDTAIIASINCQRSTCLTALRPAATRRLEMARTMRGKPVSADADRPTLDAKTLQGGCDSHVAEEYSLERVESSFATQPAKLRSILIMRGRLRRSHAERDTCISP